MTERAQPTPRSPARFVACAPAVLLCSLFALGSLASERQPLRIDDIIDRAVESSPKVRVAKEEAAKAAARHSEEVGRAFPRVTLTSLFSVAPGHTGDPLEPRGSLFDHWGFVFRLEVQGQVPLYTFGALSAHRHATRMRAEAARVRMADVIREVRLDVRRAWNERRRAAEVAAVIEDGLKHIDEIDEVLEWMDFEDHEDYDQIEALMLRVRRSDLQIRLETARREETIARKRLALHLEIADPSTLIFAEEDLAPPLEALPSLDALDSLAPLLNPRLRAGRREIDAARDEHRAARRSLLPELFIAGRVQLGLSTSSDRQESPFARDIANRRSAAIMIGMQVPLDIPQRITRRDTAEARASHIARTQKSTETEVRRRVARAHGRLADDLELLPTLSEAAAAAEEWFKERREAFHERPGRLRGVLRSAEQAIDRRVAVIETLTRLNTGLALLSREVGVDESTVLSLAPRAIPERRTTPPRKLEIPEGLSPELRERLKKRLEAMETF